MDEFADSSSSSRGGSGGHDENKENNAVENRETGVNGEQGDAGRSVIDSEKVNTQSSMNRAESFVSTTGAQSSKAAASRKVSKFVATKKTPADANEPSTTVATRSTRSGKRKAVDSNSTAERDSASAPGPAPAPKPKRKKPTVRDGTKAPKPAMPYTYKERPPNATERRAAEEMEEDPWVASFTRKTAVCVGCGRTVAITGYLWDGHLKSAILDAEGRQKEGQEGRELFLPSAWRIHREACEGVAAGRAEEVKAGKAQEEPKHNMGRCRCNCAEKGVPRSKRNHM
ncbi:hypothetical protein C8R43DRAFT_1041995 [Mycena crocata]|nr:hypothetical protein C8R43DRAFT_1041995 [Mycena crocata]